MVDCIAMSPLCGIYRSTRLGGQYTSPRDKEGYHGITSILNYHIWSCLIYSDRRHYRGRRSSAASVGATAWGAPRRQRGCGSSAARIEREIVKKSRGLPADTWEMELGGGFGCLAILNPSRGSAVVVFFCLPSVSNLEVGMQVGILLGLFGTKYTN